MLFQNKAPTEIEHENIKSNKSPFEWSETERKNECGVSPNLTIWCANEIKMDNGKLGLHFISHIFYSHPNE